MKSSSSDHMPTLHRAPTVSSPITWRPAIILRGKNRCRLAVTHRSLPARATLLRAAYTGQAQPRIIISGMHARSGARLAGRRTTPAATKKMARTSQNLVSRSKLHRRDRLTRNRYQLCHCRTQKVLIKPSPP